MAHFGKELVTLVEIDQRICPLVYGVAPCTAALGVTGNIKCHNTRATCQDTANYTETVAATGAPSVLTLRFGFSQDDIIEYGPLIPSLESVDTTPGSINLGGMNRDESAMGQRESVSIVVADHKHSDNLVDPYRTERKTGTASKVTSATAQAGAVTSLTLATTASAVTDEYDDMFIRLDDLRERQITSYDGTTKVATVPQWAINLALWSEDLTNAVWVKNDTGIDGGQNTDPNGGATAYQIIENSTTNLKRIYQVLSVPNGIHSFHVLIKAAGRTQVEIIETNEGGAIFNLSAGTVALGSADAATIEDVGNDWFLCSVQVTIASGTLVVQVRLMEGGTTAYLGDGSWGVFAWGLAVYPGVIQQTLADYLKTTTTAFGIPTSSNTYEVFEKYTPYESGTFWGKWLARNPYKSSFRARVYTGHRGDLVSEMDVRHYILDKIDGPADGTVKIELTDLFSIIERQKAVAPIASLGELAGTLTSGGSSATLSPTGIGNSEYPASFTVRIGEELMIGTRSGDTLTFTTRGAYGTTAAAHATEDLVQVAISYTAQTAVDIVYDLLLNYTSLTAGDMPKTQWDIDAVANINVYTANIAEPTPVIDLIGELTEIDGFTMWADPRNGHIKYKALRAKSSASTVTHDGWIVDESFSMTDEMDRRASQVWVYYGMVNPIEDLDETSNYRSRLVAPDLDSEGSFKYGTPSIVTVFSRWIPQFGRSAATSVAERILNMFVNPPMEVDFRVHASRYDDFAIADFFTLRVPEIQDFTGAMKDTQFATVEIERDENEISIKGQQVAFAVLSDSSGDRIIYIEQDTQNVNLRTVHDSLFVVPIGGSPGEVVRFIINAGITVSSASTSTPALQTGDWPDGVALHLQIGESAEAATVVGMGGNGGRGGDMNNVTPPAVGLAGGDAIRATFRVFIDNLYGNVLGGGGGGGGGGGDAGQTFAPYGGGTSWYDGGGGGGGGATLGSGASQGIGGGGRNGAAGTMTTGGVGGNGTQYAGAGGNGGNPGFAGGTGGTSTLPVAGAAGGAVGKYINGSSFAIWVNNGNRLGGTS